MRTKAMPIHRTTPALSGVFFCCLLVACHEPPPGMGQGRRITSLVEDWRDEVIYQVLVDRFADGDYSNNVQVDQDHLTRYQGGDWRGIIERIPYLKALGVTALWISPVVKNVEQDAGISGYHGYWTQDFLGVNPHFGDLAALQEMVDALHEAGIKVILDVVLNHIGPLFYYDVNQNGQPDEFIMGSGSPASGSANRDPPGTLSHISEWDPDYDSRGVQAFTALGEAGPAPLIWTYQPRDNRVPVQPAIFQQPNWYHRNGRVTVWSNMPELGQPPCAAAPDNNVELCPYVREQEIRGDFPGGLKDLATENAEVRDALIRVFGTWIAAGDFDGFRLDTVKHMTPEFVSAFAAAMRQKSRELGKDNFLLFGEVFSGADRLVGAYTKEGGLDSVIYFPQKFRVFDDVFKRSGAPAAVARLHEDRALYYGDQPWPSGLSAPPRDLLINFLDNHDVARFLNEGSVEALHSALLYLLTAPGIPCLYYGTEQRFTGGNDPANREVLWHGNLKAGLPPYDTQNPTFQYLAALIALRKQYAPLRRGVFELRWAATAEEAAADDAGILAYERSYQGATLLTVINTSECTPERQHSWTHDADGPLQSSFAPGSTLKNVLPDEDDLDQITVGPGGALDMRVPCRGGKIWVLAQ